MPRLVQGDGRDDGDLVLRSATCLAARGILRRLQKRAIVGEDVTFTVLPYHSKLVPESPTSQSNTELNCDNISVRSQGDGGTSAKVLTTAELAESLGKSRTALNERVRRAGGGAIGLELEGWKIVGKTKPAQGGPPQWQWQAI